MTTQHRPPSAARVNGVHRTMYGSPRKHSGSARHEGSRGPSSAERGVQQAGPGDGTATRVRAGGVTGPRRRGCAAPGCLRAAPAAAAGLKRARESCSRLRSERVACKRMVLSPCSGTSWECRAARQACRSRMMERERASACASACQAQNASSKQREGGLARIGGPLQGSNGARKALPHTVSRPD